MTVDKWQPIADYEVAPLHLADKELAALAGVWAEQKAKLRNLSEFTDRLKREWAIETGLIERLYTLDRGITEIMIEQGINAALIPNRSTQEPNRTAALIGDQEAAIDSVFSFVKGERDLSTSYIIQPKSCATTRTRGITDLGGA